MAKVSNRRDIIWRHRARVITVGACIAAFAMGLLMPTSQPDRYAAVPKAEVMR